MLADDEFDEYPDQIFTDDEREAGIPELLRKNKLNQSRGKNKSFQRYKSVHVDIPNKKTPKRIRDILNWLFFSKFTTHSHDYFTIKKQSKGRLKSGQIVILFEWLETEGIVNYFKGWRSKIVFVYWTKINYKSKKVIESNLKTPAELLGSPREGSYIYGVNKDIN